jgi:hypothetical protein
MSRFQIFQFAFNSCISCLCMAATAYFEGDVVTSLEQLESYRGMAAVDHVVGDLRKKAYVCNHEQLGVNYGDNVEFQLRREQVILTPQTQAFLYGREGVPAPRYAKGSRPRLERIVAELTEGKASEQERALAIMRFCRDLKKKGLPGPGHRDWFYGGTEETLIDKGEDLCETLGRLFTALCEVAGIPARIIMHDIGGHITAEAFTDGHWGYCDPRFGVYFLKEDGRMASLWELMQNPDLTLNQPETVKADIGGVYTWEERAQRCREKFFAPQEINGFEYYSLADAARYRYGTVSEALSVSAGLYVVNAVYGALITEIFGLGESHLEDYFWKPLPLNKLELAWRTDGFSPWYEMPANVSSAEIERRHISPFDGGAMDYVIWGTGPGSTFTHRTQAGELFGYAVTEEEWKEKFRPGDWNIHKTMHHYISQGIDPMAMMAELAHKHGLKLFSRLEMNHEYGPVDSDSWMWVGFVGELNKRHPEYRIKGNANLDFSFKEVRDFKLAILRELAASGVDGVDVDLAVYPPFFTKPDPEIMNGFIRDVRKMLDEEGEKQGKRIALQVAIPSQHLDKYGLDWQTWLDEGLVDVLVPTAVPINENRYEFDVRVEPFLRKRKKGGCKIYGGLDQSLRIFNRDPHPDGIKRFARGKSIEEFYAQLLMFMRSGADGAVFNFASSSFYASRAKLINGLKDPANVEFAPKNYFAGPFLPLTAIEPKRSADSRLFTETQLTRMRVADDIAAARRKSLEPNVSLILNFRALTPHEKLEVYLNGHLLGTHVGDAEGGDATSSFGLPKRETDLMVPDWWKKGMHTLAVPPDLLWLGENVIRMVYSTDAPAEQAPLHILWPEIQIRY